MLEAALDHPSPFCSPFLLSSGPPLTLQARLRVGVDPFDFMHLLGKHQRLGPACRNRHCAVSKCKQLEGHSSIDIESMAANQLLHIEHMF